MKERGKKDEEKNKIVREESIKEIKETKPEKKG